MLLLLVEELLFFDERRQGVHLTQVEINYSEFHKEFQKRISALNVTDELESSKREDCMRHSLYKSAN